jgi:hypothetical protein
VTNNDDELRTPDVRQGVGHAGLEVAVGAASAAGDVAAIASEHVLAVADSPGGHGSGWVAARFIAHAIATRFGGDDVRAAGAAEQDPDDKRWTGDAYRGLAAHIDDCVDGTRDLESLFDRLDQRLRSERLMASATALTIDGTRVHGAHIGAGAACCLRVRTGQIELIAMPHEFNRVKHRITDPRLAGATLGNLIVSSLGSGPAGGVGVGVDSFRTELELGDVIVLMSRPVELPLLELVRAHREQSVGALARAIEGHLDRTNEHARRASFALARCTDIPAERRHHQTPAEQVHPVSVTMLRDNPMRYSGKKVRFRASATHQLEAMQILGAWWSPLGQLPPAGTHLVDVEGVWRAVPAGARPEFGHFGQWHASIAAHVQLVSADAPSECRGGRVEEAPEFEWLACSGELRCMISGQTWRGLDVRGTTSGWLVPRPTVPEVRRIDAVLFRDGRTLFVHSARLSEPRTLTPSPATVAEIRQLTTAEYVEVEGELALGPEHPFADHPELLSWPVLAGMEVCLPGLPSYNLPTYESARAWLEPLGSGPRRVRIVAEVDPDMVTEVDGQGIRQRARHRLLATSVEFL